MEPTYLHILKVNAQLGLNNLHPLDSHISMLAKCDLPTERFLKLSPALRNAPVITFTDDKSLYFAGKTSSHMYGFVNQ
jgi:hypothetical protein